MCEGDLPREGHDLSGLVGNCTFTLCSPLSMYRVLGDTISHVTPQTPPMLHLHYGERVSAGVGRSMMHMAGLCSFTTLRDMCARCNSAPTN